MKQQATMTDRIVKNFNHALEAIPRALHLEDNKPLRRARPRKKARKTVSSSAKRTISSGLTTLGRAAKKAKRKGSSVAKKASRSSARGKRKSVKKASSRSKRSAESRQPTMRKTLRSVARKAARTLKPRARKATRTRKQSRTTHQMPVARAA